MDHVVVDVEIQKIIEETEGGWDATDVLDVSTAVVYEYATDRFRVYGHTNQELDALRMRLLDADRITGFNIFNFDFPVIWNIRRNEWSQSELAKVLLPKTNDILRRIWLSSGLNPDEFSDAHQGVGLDSIARGTLGKRKIGHGSQAPKWFQSGQWGKLVNYCVDDVALERDLSDFIDRYGYVVSGVTGNVLKITAQRGV